jgi:N utilization substance protein B
MGRRPDKAARARSQSRRLALQALYQWQLAGQSVADLSRQYAADESYASADAEYFATLLRDVVDAAPSLDERLQVFVDRPLAQLDPIERAVLWIGIYELAGRLDVPYRVVINEAVELAKRFGATDGYRYVNAVLDRAARDLRAAERATADPTGT